MLKNIAKKLLYKMLLIRDFENAVSEGKMNRTLYGNVHCYNGEEAVAVGVCSALNKEDYIISNHRPHGHAIAKGISVKPLMAEIYGKATGTNGGKGGSMHVNSQEYGMITATGIVGSGIPVAVGAAFSSKYKKDGKVTVLFFGDGAAGEGVLHECLNLAAVWNLPLLFVLEHNGLAITVSTKITSAISDYTKLAEVYGLKSTRIDGQDIQAVYETALQAVESIRKSGKPYLIQADTIRFNEHAEGPYYLKMRNTNYRDNDEVERCKIQKCPIKLYEKKLLFNGILTQTEVEVLHQKAAHEIKQSIEFALSSPNPDVQNAYTNIYAKR